MVHTITFIYFNFNNQNIYKNILQKHLVIFFSNLCNKLHKIYLKQFSNLRNKYVGVYLILHRVKRIKNLSLSQLKSTI